MHELGLAHVFDSTTSMLVCGLGRWLKSSRSSTTIIEVEIVSLVLEEIDS